MSLQLRRRASPPYLAAASTALPVGDRPHWTQIVADDFNYTYPVGSITSDTNGNLTSSSPAYAELGNKFTFYPDGWNSTWGGKSGTDTAGNAVTIQAQYYPSKTVSFANSCAVIQHHSESISGTMTALGATIKPINPSGTYNFGPYMRWQFRMRATGVNATPSYFHWVPLGIDSNNWPSNGELDWPEGDIAQPIAGNYHPANPTNVTQHVNSGEDPSAWNIFTVEWTPGNMKWWVNNTLRLNTTDRVPTGPMAFLFQHETTNVQPDPATVGKIEIDWLAMWNYTA